MADTNSEMVHISEIVENLLGKLDTMAEQYHMEEHVPEVDLLDGDDNECFFI